MAKRKKRKWGPGNPLYDWQQKQKGYKQPKRNRTRGKPSMARRRRRRSYAPRRRTRRQPRTIPILPLVGLAPPVFNLISWVKDPLSTGNFEGAAYNAAYSLAKDFAGYDLNEQRWTGGNMVQTYGALLMGYIGHKLATMFGVNRIFARLPSPLNKLRL